VRRDADRGTKMLAIAVVFIANIKLRSAKSTVVIRIAKKPPCRDACVDPFRVKNHSLRVASPLLQKSLARGGPLVDQYYVGVSLLFAYNGTRNLESSH